MEDTNKAPEQSVGEEIVSEITEAKNDKNRKVMKHHLKWLLSRVSELTSQKNGTDEALKNATEGLDKVKGMSLDDFETYLKQEKFDGPPPMAAYSMYSPVSEFFEQGTVAHNKVLLKKKLKLTFDSTRQL
jgi:hypothetical protein